MLEQATAPAFERDIEDCRTLIRFFQLRAGGIVSGTSTPIGLSTSSLGGKLEGRVVDTSIPAGQVALKKKGEDEEFFMGGGGKKGKKGPKKELGEKKDSTLNLPFGTLSALLLLGIESPTLVSQIAPTVEALEVKMKYFLDNSVRLSLFLKPN